MNFTSIIKSFACCALAVSAPSLHGNYSYKELFQLPESYALIEINGISADGSVVVGTNIAAGWNMEGFIWDKKNGLQDLASYLASNNVALEGIDSLAVNAISADGSTLVGAARLTNGRTYPFYCTKSEFHRLGYLEGGLFDGGANGVSADGSVILGYSQSKLGQIEAFRWTAESGMKGLGMLAGRDSAKSYGNGVSADGKTAVGWSISNSLKEAFVWTEADGMQPLKNFFQGSKSDSYAVTVSADGSVIAGYATADSSARPVRHKAVRWKQYSSGKYLLEIATLGNGQFEKHYVSGMSADGQVIVGTARGKDIKTAFICHSDKGLRPLADYLSANGFDMTGISLETADAISADGKIIVGSTGKKAWMVTLP